jgi:DNA polymerase-1
VNKHLHDELIEQWGVEMQEVQPKIARLLNEDRWAELDSEEVEDLLLAKVVAKYKSEFAEVVDSLTTGRYEAALHWADELQSRWEVEEDAGLRRAQRRVWKNIVEFNYSIDSSRNISDWMEDNVDADILDTWPRTENTGVLKTDAYAFATHPEVEALQPILTYKKAKKKHSTYGKSLQEFFIEHPDGSHRIHPAFSLCWTGTGRMSSFQPNLQNQPSDAEFRNIYVPAAQDRVLLISDFSQIEVRVAAYISGEPGLIEVYEKGLDVYSATAARMFDLPLDQVGKGTRERQLGKIAVLSLMYGSGPTRLRAQARSPKFNLNISEEEAADVVEKFRQAYPVYRAWQKKVAEIGENTGYSFTELGKRRALDPDKTYTTSMNTPVQGTAAEIMLDSMVRIFNGLVDTKQDARLVNVVHDEVVVDSHETCADAVSEIIKKSMEAAMLNIFPQATLKGLSSVDRVKAWGEVDK